MSISKITLEVEKFNLEGCFEYYTLYLYFKGNDAIGVLKTTT